jgi:hypothetical protein
MQGFQSGNLDRLRGRLEGKPGAVALIAVVAMVSLAAVACSSEEAEHPAGEEHGTAVSGSNPAASQTTSDQTPSRFVGTWTSTELHFDESSQTMTIRPAEDGALDIALHDDSSVRCSDRQPRVDRVDTPSTLIGTGRLEDATTLVVPSPVLACVDGREPTNTGFPEEGGTSYMLVLDLATDRLFDNLGVAWHRGAAPESWADPSTEAGADRPGTFAMLHGEVTFRAAEPWAESHSIPPDPRLFSLVGLANDERRPSGATITILVNSLPPHPSCDSWPAPPSAEALVQAIPSNPNLEATVPVTERLGGIDALRMDVVAASGTSFGSCSDDNVDVVLVPGRGGWGGVEPGGLGRLYVLDLPGGSARTLAILITAPEAGLFERAVDAAAPVLDSFRIHSSPSRFVAERFDSPLNGLSIGYPSGWQTRAATQPWGHGEVAFGAPDVDVIFHPKLKDDLYFGVVSEPFGGTSGPDWVSDIMVNLPSVGICKRAYGGAGGNDTLEGNFGWFEGCGTPLGSDSVGIVATATRGYIIYLHVGEEPAAVAAADRIVRLLPARYDGDWLWAALQTVGLRPEDAVEASSP